MNWCLLNIFIIPMHIVFLYISYLVILNNPYLFCRYEEFEHAVDKKKYVSPVGFCSVYKFFAYPDKIRPRISQFFVLPSHQRKGIGSKLYHSVMNHMRGMTDVVDITGKNYPIIHKISVRSFT